MKKTDLPESALDIKMKINLALAVLAIFLIGSVTGYGLGYWRCTQILFPEIVTVQDINPGVAMVQLLEVKGGELKGAIGQNPLRLIYGPDRILELNDKQNFSIPLNQISLKQFLTQNEFPENIAFVASKKGKYYYSTLDSQAAQITPKNRIYFKTKEAAEEAGFRKPK